MSTLPIVESNRLQLFSDTTNQPSLVLPCSPQSSDYGSDSDFEDGIQALPIDTSAVIGSSSPNPGAIIATFSNYDLRHSSVSYVVSEENNAEFMPLFFQTRRELGLLRPIINLPFSSSQDGNSFPLDTHFHSPSSDYEEESSGSEGSELFSQLERQLEIFRSANSHHNPSNWHSLKDEDYLLGRTWRYLAEF
jgi:hypothetical protein